MKEFKMSNWFNLPVDCDLVLDDTDVDGSQDSISIYGYVVLTSHHVEKVEIAINEHDKLIKQVELLTAQKAALIEYIKNPPQPSEETKRINEYWRGYNAN